MPHPDVFRLVLTVISLALLPAMIKRPFYGLLSYMIIMMLRPGAFYPALGNIRIEFTVAILIFIVIAFSPGRITRLNIATEPIFKWLFLFLIVVTLSMFQAIDYQVAKDRWMEFFKVFLFFIMVVTLLDNERDIAILLGGFAIVTFIIGYSAIYNYMQGNLVEAIGQSRTDYAVADERGMGSGHVALANILLQALPFVWFLFVRNEKTLFKVFGLFFFAWCTFGVFVAGSRGGFVGFVAFAFMLAYFSKNRIFVVIGSVFIIIGMLSFFGAQYENYILSVLELFKGGSELTSSSRFIGLRHGLEMMIKKPLLGVGPGCYPIARKMWFGWGLWSHNHYGQLIGDLGIIGTFVWSGFLYSYLKRTWQLRNEFYSPMMNQIMLAVIVTTVVRLVVGMGSHSLYIFVWYMLAGVVIVATTLLPDEDEEEETDEEEEQESVPERSESPLTSSGTKIFHPEFPPDNGDTPKKDSSM